MKRRSFLKLTTAAAISAGLIDKAQASPSLAHYVDAMPILPTRPASSSYTVNMTQFTQKLHRDLPATTLWGYDGQYPGPTFVNNSRQTITVKWESSLPSTHLFPIDHTIHGAGSDVPDVRNVVHVHGGSTLPDSDGYPEAWFTAGYAVTGSDFTQETYTYPNSQPATMLWHHDHAMGITRINVCAGLAGAWIIRDQVEANLNLASGEFEIVMIVQDRLFNSDGSIDYPAGSPQIWIPDYFGDTPLVNGKCWPYLSVQPRKYRLRILNASNARFYYLGMSNGLKFTQIGTDQGFVKFPTSQRLLLLAPGERTDVIADFSTSKGQTITLKNAAQAPFPVGNSDMPEIMQFRVATQITGPPDTSSIPTYIAGARAKIDFTTAVVTRDIRLDELIQNNNMIALLELLHWDDPITVQPRAGTVEIWRLINTSSNAHPFHAHLAYFNVLDRTPFDVNQYLSTGVLVFTGPAVQPTSAEKNAPKDTVISAAGMVTRIALKFDLPSNASKAPGQSLRYVYHCHILEHEDNEMMRPFNLLT